MEKVLCDLLLDQSKPIAERFRALFSIRNLKGAGPRDAQIIATRDLSNLLAHEAAFALGQMQDTDAIPALVAVLNDLSLHPIVRHENHKRLAKSQFSDLESTVKKLIVVVFPHRKQSTGGKSAAEALGAIALESSIPILNKSSISDPAQEVRETCELALSRIEQLKNDGTGSKDSSSPFLSVDPATPACCSSVNELRYTLLNEDKEMHERYGALFALRNHGGDEAISAIIDSLDCKSALLRHEVAYVLGQLQNKKASDALCRTLRDLTEHPMVRHEAAEALSSIADDNCISLLEEFIMDSEPIVSQSCEAALSMLEFEQSGKSFETPQVEKSS